MLAGPAGKEADVMPRSNESDEYDSARWTGYSEPIEAEALMAILAVGALCFLIVGLETL
jgi:hypothetical protein